MAGESSSKKKKKLQTKSPQSPATSSDVVEESTPANQEFLKKVSAAFVTPRCSFESCYEPHRLQCFKQMLFGKVDRGI